MSDKIFIFDTTLRDGEQSAGVAFTPTEKLEIAKQLEILNVDIIEAGFPATSPGDLKAVQNVSKTIKNKTICALARAVRSDIDTAYEGVKQSDDPRIHVFINSSDIQMAHQLQKGKEDVLKQAESMVKHAASLTSSVEFSPMDATRSDREFLYQIIERCIHAGATVINVPDSVGYSIPEETAELFRSIKNSVPNIDKAILSFHGQNDLGLTSANTLSAIQAGVRQVECTINGIGERAGNTALEEIVMAIKTRADFLKVYTDINIGEIYRTSRMVEAYSGMPIQWNKAIVGKNAFRHGSGIHQDGILKLRETWEIMDPKEIGIPLGTQLVLGKLSGRHAFKVHLEKLGYKLNEQELQNAFESFKDLADKKVNVDDRDLAAIISDKIRTSQSPAYKLLQVQVTSGDQALPTATVKLLDAAGQERIDASVGTGPVDAIYKAVNRITGIKPALTEFSVKSVTEGIDAQGEVTIRIERDEKAYIGRSADTDILVASANAYLQALNKMLNRD